MGPPWVTSPARKPVPAWDSFHRQQLLQGACSGVGSPWAAAYFRSHPPAAAWGPSQAAGWISSLVWCSVGYRGTTCITMVYSRGCRGISAPPLPSSLTLVSARLFISHFSFPAAVAQRFLPFLEYVIVEMPPSWLLGSAVPCGETIGAGWNSCVWHRAALASSHRNHPAAPLPAPGHLPPTQKSCSRK